MRFKISRFWQRKKKEVKKAKTPPSEKKPEKEHPEISAGGQKKYTGKHVVIVDGKIVAAAKGAKQVLAKVKKKYPNKKVILRYVVNERLLLKCKCTGK